MIEPLIPMAFMTGLLGSVHCLGMCGGLVVALSLADTGRRGGLPFHLFYHIGRLTTYTVIGWSVGWFGSALVYANTMVDITRMLLFGSDVFVILLGLGSAGIFSRFKLNVLQFDFPGSFKRLTRLVVTLKKLPPVLASLPLGLIMGFLPCGFLYAMIIAAAQSAAPRKGALMMLLFGLGTVPALFLFGTTARWLTTGARTVMLRWAGIMVALIGAYNLYRHLVLTSCCPLFLPLYAP